MAKAKPILPTLIILGLVLGMNTAPVAAAAHPAELPADRSPQSKTYYQVIPDSFEQIAENDTFTLYANKSSLAFKVVDKRSGYIWHSNLDEKAEGDRLNKTWTAFAQSGISIDYLDQKAISERVSLTNGNCSIDFQLVDQGFAATVNFIDASITMAVIVRLEENGVSVEAPFDSIKQESADFKLGMLYVYPFLGATRTDSVPGYMFIPDGSGSLIRFASATKAKNMFYGKYYGSDLGMITEMPYDMTINRAYRVSIPVFGMVHGEKQNAFISIVERGASYGEIQAHPSGIITNFNFLYSAFVYNESYFQATNRSGAGVTTLQRNTNDFDVKIHYRFLTGEESDYVGMARSYQQYLVEKGDLEKASTTGSDIGIRLEFLAGEKEKILFWYRSIPMTTISQMADILANLDVQNPEVIYYGWQPLGASTMPPTSLKLENELGSITQLRSLVETVTARGGKFYLYLDPQAAFYHSEGGYSPRNDLAMSITNANLFGYNRWRVNYYFNFDALSRHFSPLSADVAAQLQAGLALDGVGSFLYSDFKTGHFLNREDAIEKYRNLLAESKAETSFYLPNDYVFGSMQAYYDIPLGNSGYIYVSDVVPFIQIVLSGYVPYYGPAMNFSSNLQDDLLRMVDFGIYPSYFLTEEITAKILDTGSFWIYTSSYDQWGQEIEQTYQWMNNLLSPVKGASIVSREFLAEGVVATTYSNGKQIIVNYNPEPFTTGSIVINGKDAILTEAQP